MQGVSDTLTVLSMTFLSGCLSITNLTSGDVLINISWTSCCVMPITHVSLILRIISPHMTRRERSATPPAWIPIITIPRGPGAWSSRFATMLMPSPRLPLFSHTSNKTPSTLGNSRLSSGSSSTSRSTDILKCCCSWLPPSSCVWSCDMLCNRCAWSCDLSRD